MGWLEKTTVGSAPWAAPFYTAHLAPGFTSVQGRAGANVIHPREMAATSLSPENVHFTQNKAEETDQEGAVPDTEAEAPW